MLMLLPGAKFRNHCPRGAGEAPTLSDTQTLPFEVSKPGIYLLSDFAGLGTVLTARSLSWRVGRRVMG